MQKNSTFTLAQVRRPTIITALRSDTLACAILASLKEQVESGDGVTDTRPLVQRYNIMCTVADALEQADAGRVVIRSNVNYWSKGNFYPAAPSSIAPSHMKCVASSWQINVRDSVRTRMENRVNGIARQVALWFTLKWDQAKPNEMPWGVIPGIRTGGPLPKKRLANFGFVSERMPGCWPGTGE